jgi:plasmid stabilization system protein ParE
MTEPLPVELTALAAQQIRKAEAWWRVNRTAAPNAIREELQRAFTLIALQPRIGSAAVNVKLQGVRRIFLRRIKYHVYWHLVSEPQRVEVVAFWHGRRGKGPPL